jgi:hypothetical protein
MVTMVDQEEEEVQTVVILIVEVQVILHQLVPHKEIMEALMEALL